jgi:hypothetical protein
MIMWIAAIVLVAACVAVGYKQGATRAAFTFVGLVIAALLALPLAPAFEWIFPLIRLKNPLYADFGAPIIAFLVVSIAFKAIGQFVHRKIDYHFRYRRADAERAVWEVMHRRVGACVGALNGAVYFIVFATIISVFGYFTIQTGAGEVPSKVLAFVGSAAEDLQETEMDEVVAPFNPAGERYMDAADVAGLLYHNRPLVDRLYNYPVFASMAEEPMFKDLGKDRELQALVKGSASLNEILAQPKVQEVISNSPLTEKVLELDFADLKQYLVTGKSAKYSTEALVGNWAFDPLATLQLNKRLRPDVGASTWFRVKNEVTERFDGAVFTAFYDNKAKLELAPGAQGKSSPMIPVPTGRPGQTNYVPRWLNTNAMTALAGKWSGSAPNYLVTLASKTSEAKLEDNQVTFRVDDAALSFTRIPD